MEEGIEKLLSSIFAAGGFYIATNIVVAAKLHGYIDSAYEKLTQNKVGERTLGIEELISAMNNSKLNELTKSYSKVMTRITYPGYVTGKWLNRRYNLYRHNNSS